MIQVEPRRTYPATPGMTPGADRLSGSFRSLQALRAIAAMLVVLFHANHSFFGTQRYWPDRPFGALFEFGHSGVEFFFVLSGFIIFTAHRHDIGHREKLGSYAWKRFRRVYPVYWLLLLLIVPVYFIVPSFGLGTESSAAALADAFTLVHLFGSGQILLVSWTLFHEVAFYAVFAVLILDRRAGAAVVGIWMVGCVAALAAPAEVPSLLAFAVSPLHLLFGMGMAAAWLLRRHGLPAPALIVAAGFGIFTGVAATDVMDAGLPAAAMSMLYGVGSTLVVMGAVELERSGRLRIARPFVFLGDASYSVYLVHVVAMSVLAKVAMVLMAHLAIPHLVILLALLVIPVGAGLLFHLFVEVPLLACLGQIVRAPRTQLQAPALDPGREASGHTAESPWLGSYQPTPP